MSPEGRVEKEVVPKVVAKGMGCGEGWVCAERMEMPKRIHERRMRRFEAGKLGVESVLGAHLDSPTRSWIVALVGCLCIFNAVLVGVVGACIYSEWAQPDVHVSEFATAHLGVSEQSNVT